MVQVHCRRLPLPGTSAGEILTCELRKRVVPRKRSVDILGKQSILYRTSRGGSGSLMLVLRIIRSRAGGAVHAPCSTPGRNDGNWFIAIDDSIGSVVLHDGS